MLLRSVVTLLGSEFITATILSSVAKEGGENRVVLVIVERSNTVHDDFVRIDYIHALHGRGRCATKTTKGNTSGTIRALADLVFHPPKFLPSRRVQSYASWGNKNRQRTFFLCGDFFVMTRVFFLKNGSKSSHF